ncbi:MAG: hypothetical protein ACREFZ_00915 [Acetobacteraceae bacterium]
MIHESYRIEIAALDAENHRVREALMWIAEHGGMAAATVSCAAARRSLGLGVA